MLDLIDKKILSALEEDARMPITKIARRARISPQLAKFRIERLEYKKIIGEYYSVYDIALLGYTSYRVLVSLVNIDKNIHEEIINHIANSNNILWLVTCGGRYDLIFNIMARNPAHFQKLLSNIMSNYSSQMKNYIVSTTVSAHIFGRKFLGGRMKEPYFGDEKNVIELNGIDKKILKLIARDARMSYSKIAVKLNMNARTVLNRIKEMKRKGIIQGFKPLIHLENIGYQAHKILVKLNYRDKDKEKQLYNWSKQHINVTYFLNMIGGWEMEIEPEVMNHLELKDFILELKDKFSDIIKDLEIIPLYHDYFYNYYPED